MSEYIELKPDDVIRPGDEFRPGLNPFAMPVIGSKVSEYPNLKMLRPRHVVIRDAAIELLRGAYSDDEYVDARALDDLRQAIGISIEDLRKGGD